MKPFPLLPRLDISGCPLNMDVWKLLKPLLLFHYGFRGFGVDGVSGLGV